MFPGYNLPLFGGDNRLTVLDDTGWHAPTSGETSIRSSISRGIRPCSTPPRSTDRAAQGYKAGVLRAEFGNAEVRNPDEHGPWFLTENISIARTFDIQNSQLEFRFEVFNLLNRKIWATRTRRLPARTSGA